jgi:hypothetical protein
MDAKKSSPNYGSRGCAEGIEVSLMIALKKSVRRLTRKISGCAKIGNCPMVGLEPGSWVNEKSAS